MTAEECDNHLAEELFELLDDEEQEVKLTAIEQMVNLMESFSPSIKVERCLKHMDSLIDNEREGI